MSGETTPESASQTESTANLCEVSSWFYRRMAMLILLTGGLGLYFLYDGMVGYPKKNFTVSLHEAFESGQEGKEFDLSVFAEQDLEEEQLEELRKAGEAGRDGATWAGFAAERMLPEKVPERYTDEEIEEQFRFAVIMGVVALIILLFCFRQRTRKYRYDSERLVLPDGRSIPFATVRELDLQKWDRGIALLTCEEASGETRSVKLDDYKYVGVGGMLLALCEARPGIEVEGDRRWLEVTAAEAAGVTPREERGEESSPGAADRKREESAGEPPGENQA